MSADNWTTCPQCEKRWAHEQSVAAQKAEEAYGTASLAEFLSLKAKAEEAAPTEQTLREDWEIGIAGGSFTVSYRSGCDTCGFSWDFKTEVEPPVSLAPDKPARQPRRRAR